jgi:hypothetical protein
VTVVAKDSHLNPGASAPSVVARRSKGSAGLITVTVGNSVMPYTRAAGIPCSSLRSIAARGTEAPPQANILSGNRIRASLAASVNSCRNTVAPAE